jgi:hypothetical protein
MNLILVPTLAELQVELDRADGARRSVLHDEKAYQAAVTQCWQVLDQIAGMPAACLADLRVKAYAFDWSARLLDDEPYCNPSPGEELILRWPRVYAVLGSRPSRLCLARCGPVHAGDIEAASLISPLRHP